MPAKLEAAAAVALALYFAVAVTLGRHYRGAPPPLLFPAPSGSATVWKLPILQGSYAYTRVTPLQPPSTDDARLEPANAAPFGIARLSITFPRLGDAYVLSVWTRGNTSSAGKHVSVILEERSPGGATQEIAGVTHEIPARWRRIAARGRVQRAGDTLDAYVVVSNDIAPRDALSVRQWRLRRIVRHRKAKLGPR